MRKTKIVWLLISISTFLTDTNSPIASAQQAKKPFTIADEIGLTLFDDPNGAPAKVLFSPDGTYFAVWTEHGRVELNRVVDSLRFYRSDDIEDFLKHPDVSQPPPPVWVVDRSGVNGGIISDWCWLADSSGVAFLDGQRDFGDSDKRLVLADVGLKVIEPLTSTTEVIGTFNVRDREHYVYTAFDRTERDASQQQMRAESQAGAMVGTGRSLRQLLFPDDGRYFSPPPSYLWAVINGKRFEVKQDGAPVVPGEDLALSPDGSSLVTTLPVREVPSSWETLYPPPFESSPFRIGSGHDKRAHEYVKIDLQTGSVQSLTEAPIAWDAGWNGHGSPSWSSDSRAILLPDTFLSSRDHTPSRPCVAVVELSSGTRTCVEMLKRQTEERNYYLVLVVGAFFADGNKERVVVSTYLKSSFHNTEYHRISANTWQFVSDTTRDTINDTHDDHRTFTVMVKEGLDEPPLLIAQNKQRSRVIWDPNPQLTNIELGHASLYAWKDKEGRELKGGLYSPVDYKPGHRYPLVIQTHGFRELEFRPSGFLTTGFAARLLAAAGMFVLQIGEQCPVDTPAEGSCAVATYESAVHHLVSDGLVDPERVGIIGFSRSCYWVMEALTTRSLHLRAALITDGFMATYVQYITEVDWLDNAVPRQFDSMIGAVPFGEGMQLWLRRSPGFNLDKITTPLQVVAGYRSLLFMWEPYAGLRYLHRPVDLLVLNTNEHVVTNPAVRMASQGGSVDWFRFWLKGEEESDPAKTEQYARWRMLRQSCATNCEQQTH